jgi:O-acetylhomoserine (thiol)-lyase
LAYIIKARVTLIRIPARRLVPFHTFLLLKGLETLSLRVERHVENALKLVRYLAAHPLVERVNHPALEEHPDHALYNRYFSRGAGSIFTFEIKGDAENAKRFIERLELFSLAGECRGM